MYWQSAIAPRPGLPGAGFSLKGIGLMNTEESAAVRKAGLLFRKETQAREGAEAWNVYNAHAVATRQQTAKLRAERLAREASARVTAPAPKRAKKATLRRA
jgi:GMP synthase PP-ATPase subunit